MTICNICITDIKRGITCPVCNYQTCYKCAELYLLSVHGPPTCMECKQAWTEDYINTTFSNQFRTGSYKQWRGQALLERERLLLPDTQDAATYAKLARRISQVRRENDAKIRGYMDDICKALAEKDSTRVSVLRTLIKKHKMMAKQDESILRQQRNEYAPWRDRGASPDQKQKSFMRPCPAQDCRGYVPESGTCKLCGLVVCTECYNASGTNHVCDNDTLATIKELKASTRNCPKCFVPIHRISGCDLMWCVQCHVNFSWSTGELVKTEYNHNPHYFEWMRQNNRTVPRAPGDGGCNPDAEPELAVFSIQLFERCFGLDAEYVRVLWAVEHELDNLRRKRNHNNNRGFLRLRVAYLLGDFSEEGWKARIIKLDKEIRVLEEYIAILSLYTTITREIIVRVTTHESTSTNTARHAAELREIYNYVYDRLRYISKTYNVIIPREIDAVLLNTGYNVLFQIVPHYGMSIGAQKTN